MQSKYDFDFDYHRETLVEILKQIIAMPTRPTGDELSAILRRHTRKDDRSMHSRTQLVQAYRKFAGQYGLPEYDEEQMFKLRRKPMRTISGVTPVTVLTKPFPCPGECIFCPNDVRMPKSYLSDEPGAQRAMEAMAGGRNGCARQSWLARGAKPYQFSARPF